MQLLALLIAVAPCLLLPFVIRHSPMKPNYHRNALLWLITLRHGIAWRLWSIRRDFASRTATFRRTRRKLAEVSELRALLNNCSTARSAPQQL